MLRRVLPCRAMWGFPNFAGTGFKMNRFLIDCFLLERDEVLCRLAFRARRLFFFEVAYG